MSGPVPLQELTNEIMHAHMIRSVAVSRLGRHTLYNLLGSVIPSVAAVFAMPRILTALGLEQFGVLSLLWAVVGYFSVFDFGLGRALTKLVAEKRANGDTEGMRESFWVATWYLTLSATIIGALVILGLTIATKAHVRLNHDVRVCAYVGSALLPAVVASAAFRGFLEAHERFDLINVIRTVAGSATFLGTLVAIRLGPPLPMAVAALAVMRIGSTTAFLVLCITFVPALRASCRFRKGAIKPLLRLGGWMTVSNLISPLMVYLDRFIVGGLLSLSSLAFYTAPFDVVTKLLLIPTAFSGVLFPRFSALSAAGPSQAAVVYRRALLATFAVMLIPITVTVLFAKAGLTLWLGPEFGGRSSLVVQILAIGVMLNGLGSVPYALLQGLGRPDLTAKLHIFEVPIYLIACVALTTAFGIRGTALAWTIRVLIDTSLLLCLGQYLIRPVVSRVGVGLSLSRSC